MIELDKVTFRFREGSLPAIRDVSLRIPDGQFVGVTGAAGSGKSTLTYILNGIVPHCYPGDFYGRALVNGHDTVDTSLTDLSRLVGSVCQDVDSQMVSTVVEDEMLFGLENFGVSHEEMDARVDEALEIMGISELRDRTIAGLSGGQRQKVAVAEILALRPAVLVLDEPTAELDPVSSRRVFARLREYASQRSTTVVVIEQKIALLAEYADRILVMRQGAVLMDGAPSEVLEHADLLLAEGINCPRSTTLVERLRTRGLYAGRTARTVREAAGAVREVIA
jgi:energy-coupling factor transport system ATP-binding protein